MDFMNRSELIHPMLVHFPVALVIIAFMLSMASFLKLRSFSEFAQKSACLISILAGVSIWPAYLSGNMAEDVVNKVICDPTATHLHADWALWTGICATIAGLIAIIRFIPKYSNLSWPKFTLILFQLAASVLVAYTGHLGAELTYSQAAAVKVPSQDCHEFE